MQSTERVAVISGATRGIGRAIALGLGADGFTIVANYRRREDEARSLAGELTAAGVRHCLVRGDVASAEEAGAIIARAMAEFGRIDALVNNAGTHVPGLKIGDTPYAEWARVWGVNVDGALHLIQAVLPIMRAQGGGNIVNITSNVTQRLPATYGAYTVSKVALEAMTRILAKEEGVNGIRVNAVAPGPIATEMLQESFDVIGAERAAAFLRTVPLGRAGRPEEIAAVVRFVVSEAASYVTGHTIFANGGGPGG